MPQSHVYILASKRNGTLYIGVTTELSARVFPIETVVVPHSPRNMVSNFWWYETYDMVVDAIQRETALKHWLRKWKLELIEKSNPNWDDLYETL